MTIVEQPIAPEPLRINETFSLSCAASSIPRPLVSWFWFEDGVPVELVGGAFNTSSEVLNETTVRSTLQSGPVNESDFSQYFCRGDNGFVSTDSESVEVVMASKSVTHAGYRY